MASGKGGLAERLHILLAVSADLIARTYRWRTDLRTADFSQLFLSEKVAKRLEDKFPKLVDALKEKDQGYDVFVNNAPSIEKHFRSFFTLLEQCLEFKEAALALIHELSSQVLKFSLDENELVFVGYYSLMLGYAKLHFILSALASPSGRGRLALAAFAKSHGVTSAGHVPEQYEGICRYLLEYDNALPKLQEDMLKAKLRVADTLLPLGPQIIRLSDISHLRSESVLYPLLIPTAQEQHAKTGGAGGVGGNRGSVVTAGVGGNRGSVITAGIGGGPSGGPGGGGSLLASSKNALDVEPLLACLPQAREWLLYGLLLYPDDLAETGAIDLLIGLLNMTYVLPVHGSEIIYPHALFDADGKTLTRWIKRKEDVKRFQALLRESRLTAFRGAASVHATIRAILATKLARIHAVVMDAPRLLCSRLPILLTAMRLAQDEVQWWVLHVDAVLEELPRKEREAERDASAFSPAGVQELLRLTSQLHAVVLSSRANLVESAAQTMRDRREAIEKYAPSVNLSALSAEVGTLLRELPAQIGRAGDVGADLTGLRLSVLRLVCELSKPSGYGQLATSEPLRACVGEAVACAHLSRAVDTTQELMDEVTEATALMSSAGGSAGGGGGGGGGGGSGGGSKLERLFASALETRPSDCLALLRLAARDLSAETDRVQPLLEQLASRFHYLLNSLCFYMRKQRAEPRTPAPVADAPHQICTLCQCLDSAPALDCLRARRRVNLQSWLRHLLEQFVDACLGWVLFERPESNTPRLPSLSLELLSDLSHTLSILEPYTSLNLHAIIDAAVVRSLGALDSAPPHLLADALSGGRGSVAARQEASETFAVRAEGPAIDADIARQKQVADRGVTGGVTGEVTGAFAPESSGGAAHVPGSGAGARGSLISRLKLWLRKELDAAQRLDGPQYVPGQRCFEGTSLDAFQLGALARVIGSAGMRELDEVVLDAACHAPMALRDVLKKNRDALRAVEASVTTRRELPSEPAVLLSVINLPVVLICLRSFGVALVARSLLQEGLRIAKRELQPPVVASFVHGLGSQQLPDGARAGTRLEPVKDLLAGFGQLTGGHNDAPLSDAVARTCMMADEPKLWAALPYALALIFTLPDWHSVGVNLERDGLAANTHCLVHALDALLSFVEPHMPREEHEPISESGVTKAAHRTFLHVASLILLDRRRSLAEAISQQPQQPGGKDAREVASKERSIAAILLVLEQLSQLAEPLGYGDLQPYLPASMLLASYGAIAQPVSVDGGDADTGGGAGRGGGGGNRGSCAGGGGGGGNRGSCAGGGGGGTNRGSTAASGISAMPLPPRESGRGSYAR